MRRSFFILAAGIVSAALAGYISGWILGWSAFDPETDLWALLAALGALAGMVYALLCGQTFWRRAAPLLGAAAALYPGWVLRTLLFGDVPGGAGLLLVLVCGAAGGACAARTGAAQRVRLAQVLAGALGGAVFGGLLVEVLLFRLALAVTGGDMILQRAPGVLLFGVRGAGGAAAAERTRSGGQGLQT